MREILDNARYAPTVGRYKVYLIDEVHMLSKAAFNSMLKTLEEPPEHVKFVLATTDPQKIPVTVLSRCLQFNLKPLPPTRSAARIDAHPRAGRRRRTSAGAVALHRARRARVAARRAVAARPGDRLRRRRGARGGRPHDAGRGRPRVRLPHRRRAGAGDGAALLAEADALAARGLSPASALDELASLFHRIAVAQVVPAAAAALRRRASGSRRSPRGSRPRPCSSPTRSPRRDGPTSPSRPTRAIGLAMTLLRMLAFEPAAPGEAAVDAGRRDARVTPASASAAPRRARSAAASLRAERARCTAGGRRRRTAGSRGPRAPATLPRTDGRRAVAPLPDEPAAWPAYVAGLRLTGMAAQLAAQTELRAVEGHVVTLRAAGDAQAPGRQRLLRQAQGGARAGERPQADARLRGRRRGDRRRSPRRRSASAPRRRERTEAAFRDEPFVRDLVERFDARVRPDSIKPL